MIYFKNEIKKISLLLALSAEEMNAQMGENRIH